MPRFRIQSNLHLDGFQMLDACLENVTSFEGLDDRNTGRIVFLNGSSSNKSNLHPAVFYGNEFKGLAYLDDIDKITNGEGSLGMRVKALEDMLNVDSAETVVSTWEEIQAFLDNVKEGTDLMTMLDGKLDKTGGTISNDKWANQLILNHSTSGEPAGLRFHSNNELMGIIYVNYQHRLMFHNGTIPNLEVLHSGNVGEYTAGAANRLANKVSLWGNEFDGTKSVSGEITGSHFRIVDNANNPYVQLGLSSGYMLFQMYNGNAYIGRDTTRSLAVTKDGNVNIGTAFEGFKFSVYGGMTFLHGVESSALVLGQMPTNGLLVGNPNYGIGQWFQGGQGHIQVGRFDGTATAYALNLNPLGGAVNVGEGGLNVATYMTIGNSSASAIVMKRGGYNYIWAPTIGAAISLGVGTENPSSTAASLSIYSDKLIPEKGNNTVSLGTSSCRWSNVYSVGGNFSGRVLIGGAEDDADYALITKGNWKLTSTDKGDYFSIKLRDVNVDYYGYDAADSWCNHNFISNGTTRFFVAGRDAEWSYIKGKFRAYGEFRAEELATFNAGALIPTGQKLTIGDATIEYDSIAKAIKVDGNLFTTGTNASGGKADAQQGGTGGNAEVHEYEFLAGQSTYTELNPKGSRNVIVQIYEWNANDNTWDMILTDVSVTNENIIVTFGRDTTVNHLMTVV